MTPSEALAGHRGDHIGDQLLDQVRGEYAVGDVCDDGPSLTDGHSGVSRPECVEGQVLAGCPNEQPLGQADDGPQPVGAQNRVPGPVFLAALGGVGQGAGGSQHQDARLVRQLDNQFVDRLQYSCIGQVRPSRSGQLQHVDGSFALGADRDVAARDQRYVDPVQVVHVQPSPNQPCRVGVERDGGDAGRELSGIRLRGGEQEVTAALGGVDEEGGLEAGFPCEGHGDPGHENARLAPHGDARVARQRAGQLLAQNQLERRSGGVGRVGQRLGVGREPRKVRAEGFDLPKEVRVVRVGGLRQGEEHGVVELAEGFVGGADEAEQRGQAVCDGGLIQPGWRGQPCMGNQVSAGVRVVAAAGDGQVVGDLEGIEAFLTLSVDGGGEGAACELAPAPHRDHGPADVSETGDVREGERQSR